eukprot:5598465-Pleurochrysis_carterae.AAC.2
MASTSAWLPLIGAGCYSFSKLQHPPIGALANRHRLLLSEMAQSDQKTVMTRGWPARAQLRGSSGRLALAWPKPPTSPSRDHRCTRAAGGSAQSCNRHKRRTLTLSAIAGDLNRLRAPPSRAYALAHARPDARTPSGTHALLHALSLAHAAK